MKQVIPMGWKRALQFSDRAVSRASFAAATYPAVQRFLVGPISRFHTWKWRRG